MWVRFGDGSLGLAPHCSCNLITEQIRHGNSSGNQVQRGTADDDADHRGIMLAFVTTFPMFV